MRQVILFSLAVSISLTIPLNVQAQVCGADLAVLPSHRLRTPITSPRVLPVIFHILHKSDNTGKIPLSEIEEQIDVLNAAFSGTYFSFTLLAVSYIESNYLFGAIGPTAPDADLVDLVMDPEHVINIFSGDLPDGQQIFGWSTFPDSPFNNGDPDPASQQHMVLIDYVTMPNGPAHADFNNGDILVHEVGHYLGLRHPHDNGCKDNDRIADTALLQTPLLGSCPPPNTDTCPQDEPEDPIDNYMTVTRGIFKSCGWWLSEEVPPL